MIPLYRSHLTILFRNLYLTGSVPPEFGDSLHLQVFYLENNKRTDSIPESLGRFGCLIKLNLARNKLSGSIPTSFGNLK
ncbi:hypothetical protein CISIN_1g036517mg [Citrus sinensis]|uniref:Malectin-like domain-containing protein n=1 Tax=Citrus sinensis TaxID=2711 RepID=A0A067DJG2_CITSI|nr:hypothetical protein CISIN_1g036517mg [Citrus sinensis]